MGNARERQRQTALGAAGRVRREQARRDPAAGRRGPERSGAGSPAGPQLSAGTKAALRRGQGSPQRRPISGAGAGPASAPPRPAPPSQRLGPARRPARSEPAGCGLRAAADRGEAESFSARLIQRVSVGELRAQPGPAPLQNERTAQQNTLKKKNPKPAPGAGKVRRPRSAHSGTASAPLGQSCARAAVLCVRPRVRPSLSVRVCVCLGVFVSERGCQGLTLCCYRGCF